VLAQLPQGQSRSAVEQELVTVATQMMANPNGYNHATMLSAQAQGLTLSLAFRMKSDSSLSVEKYADQVTSGFCQHPGMSQYTYQHGVVLAISVTPREGGSQHRFQIDRATCAKAAGRDVTSPAPSPSATFAAGPKMCSSYVGQVVQPGSFDSAIARFSSLTPKSEFETISQFQARQAQALSGLGGPLIIEKAPEDQKLFEYDADAQALRISPFAFSNAFFPAWEAIYSAGLSGSINVNVRDNVYAVTSHDERVTGSYEASNSFGAKANVASITRSVKVIFDHGPKLGGKPETLFPGSITANFNVNPVGVLRMSPEQARILKPRLRLAFVATPYQPYVIRGTTKFGKVTFQNPRDISYSFTMLTADIHCGLVMDLDGRVLGAYPTS
jgi:hypothetical protein